MECECDDDKNESIAITVEKASEKNSHLSTVGSWDTAVHSLLMITITENHSLIRPELPIPLSIIRFIILWLDDEWFHMWGCSFVRRIRYDDDENDCDDDKKVGMEKLSHLSGCVFFASYIR